MENQILQGDSFEVLKTLPNECVDCCITSPPYYGLRDYGMKEQIGLEDTPEEYVSNLVNVFREVKRVLRNDGTLWVNIADSYAGGAGRWGGDKDMSDKQNSNTGSLSEIAVAKKWKHNTIKQKDLIGIPWMLAFALRDDGWYLRQDIIWHKPNPMPESIKDRCTKSHEYIFLLSKSSRYYFDYESIQEDANYDGRKDTLSKGSQKYNTDEYLPEHKKSLAGSAHERWQYKVNEEGDKKPVRNKRDVWNVPTKPNREAHFATYPEELITPCVLAGTKKGGVVLDPFFGSGTTGRVATAYGRNYIGIELNPEYIEIAKHRANEVQLSLFSML